MHTVEGQGPTLGELQPTFDVDVPSSPLSASHLSPRTQDDMPTSTPRPPMSVVVIQESKNESPLGTLNNEDSQSSAWAPPPMMVSVGTPEESRASWQRASLSSTNESMLSTAPSGTFSSSPFKLKPRNPINFMASPTRAGSGGGATPRGRKRPAHSMSFPVGSVSSSESPLRPPRPFHGKDDRSDVSSTKAESVSGGSESTAKDASLSPPIFEMECLNLSSLSLQSPPPSLRGNRHGSSSKSRTSSFTMYGYGASPAGSVTRAANTSASESTSSSFVVGTPCSSVRSSPRHVPLTVLSQGGQSLMSPSKNSLVRPPRHGGGPSLLFSLDQDEDDSEDDGIGFPRKLPASSCNSSISSEDTERKVSMFSSPSLSSTMYTSPIKTAASPKTPLPRILLTPRTPQSTGSRRKVGLPMFPSPSDDGIDASTIGDTPQTSTSSTIDDAMDTLLNGFAKRGHPARFQSTTGYIPPSSSEEIPSKPSRYHTSTNSLAYSVALSSEDNKGDMNGVNNGHEEREEEMFPPRRTPSPTDMGSNTVNTNPPLLPRAWLLPMPSGFHGTQDYESRELPRPPPPPIERSTHASSAAARPKLSKHDSILRAMMNENARARAARADTESLSDSGEEDAFVLTCPSNVTTTVARDESHRPPKQRRMDRESQENGTTLSSNSFLGTRESCTSLASGLASANSLFGMEFYQDEGQSMTSPVYRSTTPYSSHSLRSNTHSGSNGELSTRDGDDGFAPLGMPSRFRRSENSFGSLGLSLDGPSAAVDDQGRDLVTPPMTRQVAFSPPPLPVPPSQQESFCSTPKSRNEERKVSPPIMQPEEPS